ncbi:uncharacterized protein J7T54_008207 [Emericellopsis cladophorae]|uniref:Uncharacterized protein n=1 Tax=Emericellopsis cladophorae TaxID=2686198 RepID=A0A9P9XXC9_9HYPO|nr:uncharacterized protein J7T54_008207 [Emericellopsis cladophorae]KAI6779589.1 hypothetical protein J7T54_008207 [Emericellopsis cladophorae]
MKRHWKPSPSADADPQAGLNGSRRKQNPSRVKSGSIRGHISGPIPISRPIDPDHHEQYHARSQSTAEIVHPTPIRTPLTPEPDNFYGPEGDDGPKRQKTPSPRSLRQQDCFKGANATTASNGDDGSHQDASRSGTGTAPRTSTFSPDTPSNAGSKDPTPQKKSGFRHTVGSIGRLLGLRKKKRTHSQAIVRTPESGHKSRSTMRTPDSSEKKEEDPEPDLRPHTEHKRSASLPQSMAHHSERLEDRPDSARKSLRQEFSFSRKYTDVFGKPAGGYGKLDEPLGLSPRPASVHGRGFRQKEALGQDPWYQDTNTDDIGRAITTKETYGLKRRSRSLSALGTSVDHVVEGPPLSAGFSFRRGSVHSDVKSLASSAPPPPELRAEVEVDELGNVLIAVPDSPLKPFDFNVDAMKKPQDLSITEFASFDPRITALETQVEEMRKELDSLRRCEHEVAGDAGSDSRRDTLIPPLGDGTNHENANGNGNGLALSSWFSKSSSDAPDRESAIYTASARDSLPAPQQDSRQKVAEEHTTASLLRRLEAEIRARQALEEKVARLEAQFDMLVTASGKDLAVSIRAVAIGNAG